MADEKKTAGPSLEAVLAVTDLRNAEAAAVAADTRPRSKSADAPELGESLRFCRVTPEQAFTIRTRFEGIGQKSNQIIVNDANRGHAIKVIQIGLRTEAGVLACPGEDGFNQIGRLSNAELSRLTSDALTFNEVLK